MDLNVQAHASIEDENKQMIDFPAPELTDCCDKSAANVGADIAVEMGMYRPLAIDFCISSGQLSISKVSANN